MALSPTEGQRYWCSGCDWTSDSGDEATTHRLDNNADHYIIDDAKERALDQAQPVEAEPDSPEEKLFTLYNIEHWVETSYPWENREPVRVKLIAANIQDYRTAYRLARVYMDTAGYKRSSQGFFDAQSGIRAFPLQRLVKSRIKSMGAYLNGGFIRITFYYPQWRAAEIHASNTAAKNQQTNEILDLLNPAELTKPPICDCIAQASAEGWIHQRKCATFTQQYIPTQKG